MREPDEGLVGGSDAPAWLARVGDRLAWYATAIGLERWARLLAAALVPLLQPEGGLLSYGPLVAGLAAYVLLTALARRDQYLRSADLVVAAAIILLTGPEVVPFLPFLLVTVAGPASQGGVRAGLAAGGTLAIVLLVRLVVSGDLADAGLVSTLPIALLLPLAGLTTAAATEVLEDRTVRDRMVLQEANRLLSSLRDIADEIPGGLDVSTVSAALMAELRTIPGLTGALVLVEDHGMLRAAATAGLDRRPVPPIRADEFGPLVDGGMRFVTPHALPAGLRKACADHLHWTAVPVGGRGRASSSLLLVGFEDLDAGRDARNRLASLAADARLAIENARLFDGTRVRAADAARRRVAGDLHDGVAQSLAHLRMELELLARATTSDDDELERLARVAGTALVDLRATIAGLRAPLDHDLGALLERHVEDVRSPHGPAVVLERTGANRLDPERAEEVLRVAQEAVSNALRHAQADHIRVVLEQDDERVRLVVEDDGVGLGGTSREAGGGVGLRSMEERAERLGGVLELHDGVAGGTVVHLTLPTTRPVTDVARPDGPSSRTTGLPGSPTDQHSAPSPGGHR